MPCGLSGFFELGFVYIVRGLAVFVEESKKRKVQFL